MRRFGLPFLVMALACLVIAYRAQTAGASNDQRKVRESMPDKEKVREKLNQFAAAWNEQNADRLVACYTDPYVDVNSPQPSVSREQTRAGLQQFFAHFNSVLKVTSDEVVVAGDWAFQRGEFVQTITPKQGGETQTITRRYIEVLKRQPDGTWLVAWGIDAPLRGAQ